MFYVILEIVTEKSYDYEEIMPSNEQQKRTIVANKGGVTHITAKATWPTTSISNLVNRNNAPSITPTYFAITAWPTLCLLLLGSFVMLLFPILS